jgi:hypothetical protein
MIDQIRFEFFLPGVDWDPQKILMWGKRNN